MSTTKLYVDSLANPAIPYFEINGIRMPTPSTFTWIPPAQVGITGSGKQRIYPFWGITLGWDFLNENEYAFLYNTWLGVQSGSIFVMLPITYGNSFGSPWNVTVSGTLRNWNYYNVLLDQPIAQATIENISYQNVKQTIRKIYGVTQPAGQSGP